MFGDTLGGIVLAEEKGSVFAGVVIRFWWFP